VVLRIDLLTGSDLPGAAEGPKPPRAPFWKRP
jgi:hypothetical protein